MEGNNFWKISEFSKQLGKHFTTTDNWFKQLEAKKIHYIMRDATGEKVYDDLDLQIGNFIRRGREEGLPMRVIQDQLAERFDLRPFPIEELENMASNEIVDIDAVKMLFTEMAKEIVQEESLLLKEEIPQIIKSAMEPHQEQLTLMIQQLKTIEVANQNLLTGIEEVAPTKEQEIIAREKRINDRAVARRVESKLRQKALRLWLEKPQNERYVKVGIFRKEEDITKRDLFVEEYVEEHYEDELKKYSNK
ncbi:hypothetical protein [Priestia koreensis]|uniref:hypothetical protein n=1 Tax=Priestia koreensis TaxID=284581 RepID=UPI001F579F45|nr:hypothetical protein [Priestia koreensis]UNL87449.1 hypothetical protein IE339_24340 [Priestia koreensis]